MPVTTTTYLYYRAGGWASQRLDVRSRPEAIAPGCRVATLSPGEQTAYVERTRAQAREQRRLVLREYRDRRWGAHDAMLIAAWPGGRAIAYCWRVRSIGWGRTENHEAPSIQWASVRESLPPHVRMALDREIAKELKTLATEASKRAARARKEARARARVARQQSLLRARLAARIGRLAQPGERLRTRMAVKEEVSNWPLSQLSDALQRSDLDLARWLARVQLGLACKHGHALDRLQYERLHRWRDAWLEAYAWANARKLVAMGAATTVEWVVNWIPATWLAKPMDERQLVCLMYQHYALESPTGWMRESRCELRREYDRAWSEVIAAAPFAPELDPRDGSLIGYKRLEIVKGCLMSPSQGTVWHGGYHRIPECAQPLAGNAVRNAVGIHAVWDKHSTELSEYSGVIVELRGYGLAATSAVGWRATEAVVVAIGSACDRDTLDEALQALPYP